MMQFRRCGQVVHQSMSLAGCFNNQLLCTMFIALVLSYLQLYWPIIVIVLDTCTGGPFSFSHQHRQSTCTSGGSPTTTCTDGAFSSGHWCKYCTCMHLGNLRCVVVVSGGDSGVMWRYVYGGGAWWQLYAKVLFIIIMKNALAVEQLASCTGSLRVW